MKKSEQELRFRISQELHQKIKARARKYHRKINQEAYMVLEKFYAAKKGAAGHEL